MDLKTRILVLYGTSEGQTAKIASRIADTVSARGYAADVVDARRIPADLSLDDYAAAMIGASVHVGGYQRAVREFIKRYRAALQRMPAAFFSVSLTEADPASEKRAQLSAVIVRFEEETGWHPAMIASFADALAYTRYGVLRRLAMRWIAAAAIACSSAPRLTHVSRATQARGSRGPPAPRAAASTCR